MSNKKKNYRAMYNKPESESVIPEITSIVQPEEEIEEIETPVEILEPADDYDCAPAFGYVDGCLRLNVREAPDRYAAVVCVLDVSDEVEIDESASTEDFYKVCTAAGQEGYCMKNYIVIE